MRASAVEVRDVTKAFGAGANATLALDDVSVAIAENEFFTLLGPSGCGKTTLLRLIAGFDLPSRGDILLYGGSVAHLPPNRRPVNTVFQSYALFPHLSVAENIGFGLKMLGRPKAEIAAQVEAMLRLVRLEAMRDRRIGEISGGQAQRVALARALAPRPKVLLLDEPLSALDLKLRQEMQLELKRLQAETGITFVFVTHDQEEALTMSDRIAVMSMGRIRQIGTPRAIYDHPAERFVAKFIGESNFLAGRVESVAGRQARIRLAAGASVEASLPEGFAPAGEVSVVIRPEQAELAGDGAASFSGRVESIVYFGTDTHYHLRLATGEAFTLRQRNRRDAGPVAAIGAEIGIRIGDNAAQVLKD